MVVFLIQAAQAVLIGGPSTDDLCQKVRQDIREQFSRFVRRTNGRCCTHDRRSFLSNDRRAPAGL